MQCSSIVSNDNWCQLWYSNNGEPEKYVWVGITMESWSHTLLILPVSQTRTIGPPASTATIVKQFGNSLAAIQLKAGDCLQRTLPRLDYSSYSNGFSYMVVMRFVTVD